jgi:hypothetical protein
MPPKKDVDRDLLNTRCDTLLSKLRITFSNKTIRTTPDSSKVLFEVLDPGNYKVLYAPFKVIVSSGHNKPFDAGDVVCITSNKTENIVSRNDVRFNVLREDPAHYEKLLAHIFNDQVEIKFATLYQQGWRDKEKLIESEQTKIQTSPENTPLISQEDLDELRTELKELRVYAAVVHMAATRDTPRCITGAEAGPSVKGKGPLGGLGEKIFGKKK